MTAAGTTKQSSIPNHHKSHHFHHHTSTPSFSAENDGGIFLSVLFVFLRSTIVFRRCHYTAMSNRTFDNCTTILYTRTSDERREWRHYAVQPAETYTLARCSSISVRGQP
jgi:hypothetical protein